MDSLKELFHPDAMGALVVRYAEQAQERSFLSVYEAGEPIEAAIDGAVKWEQLDYSRDLAPIVGIDSPSQSTKKLIQMPKTGHCIAIKEHVDLPARFLEGFNAPGQKMPNAAAQIANNLQNLTNRVMRTLNYLAAKTLLTSNGQVNLSAIPNSQVAGVLTYPVQSLSAQADWSNPATKIRSAEINLLRKTYSQSVGLKAREVLASSNVEGYLTGNTEITNFINGGSLAGAILGRSFEDARGAGGVVDFGGLLWNFVEDYYATDAAPNTPVSLNGDASKFAVLPDRSQWRDCFALATGVQFVPTGPVTSVQALPGTGLYQARRGFGAYVTLETNPVGLRLHVFWTGLLIQKRPKAVMVYDSTPNS